jgi:hypothetical protein
MAEQKRITELTEDTAPTANDVVPVTDVETNTTKKVKLSNLPNAFDGILKVNTPQGHMLNGKIVTSVSGGALTVAIKTLAGNDPSASDPVYVRIGNTVRAINSALSVTGSSGTNWLNLSSSELQNQEVDLFVYLRWNSLDNNINVFFSRIPYARVNTDFISSATSEKGYVSLGSYTASDECEVVGRFNAILSNTAQWSIPATSVIINRPIFNTRSLTFSPQVIGTSVSGTGQIYTTRIGRYLISDNVMDIRGNLKLSDYGSASGFLGITLPMTVSNIGGGQDKTEITGYACDVGQAPMTANKGNPTTYGGANAVYWHNSVDTNNLSISGCDSNTVFRFASRVEI